MYPTCTTCKNLEPETSFYQCTLHAKTVFNPNMAGCSEGKRTNDSTLPVMLIAGQTIEGIPLSIVRQAV